jgi:hypothetical protein
MNGRLLGSAVDRFFAGLVLVAFVGLAPAAWAATTTYRAPWAGGTIAFGDTAVRPSMAPSQPTAFCISTRRRL